VRPPIDPDMVAAMTPPFLAARELEMDDNEKRFDRLG
jgi:hypothetical protein